MMSSTVRGELAGVDGLLIDIDGVLTVGWSPIEGASEALAGLRGAGVPFRLVTNTTELSQRELVEALDRAGFDVRADEVITAAVMTAEYLREHHPGAACFVLGGSQGAEDLDGVRLVQEGADVVVIGGASRAFSFDDMNHALRLVLDGAALVGMHGAISWMTAEGMALDPGVILLRGLEAATGRVAVVCGKPAPEAFASALRLLDLPAERVAMVGDDLDTDVLAAQAFGLKGVLVRTGKFRQDALDRSAGVPDLVLDSIGELPEALR
jgi:HAD superfamily hydrolase (TIGR01458 family)